MTARQRLWLCLPITTVCLLDGTLTLGGQSPAYWNGDYTSALEFNPVGSYFLQWSPLAFVLALGSWLVLVTAGVLWLPKRWAVLFTFGVVFGHALGVATWLVRHGWFGWLV